MRRINKVGLDTGVLFLAWAATAAHAQTVNVTVPGNTLGGFGTPSCCSEPYVAALAVSGPGTITVAYISGTVTDAGGIDTGPNGVAWNVTGNQFPLQEAAGVAGGPIDNLDSLIGTFVPQSRVLAGAAPSMAPRTSPGLASCLLGSSLSAPAGRFP